MHLGLSSVLLVLIARSMHMQLYPLVRMKILTGDLIQSLNIATDGCTYEKHKIQRRRLLVTLLPESKHQSVVGQRTTQCEIQ